MGRTLKILCQRAEQDFRVTRYGACSHDNGNDDDEHILLLLLLLRDIINVLITLDLFRCAVQVGVNEIRPTRETGLLYTYASFLPRLETIISYIVIVILAGKVRIV